MPGTTTTEFVNKMVKAGAGAGKTHDLIEKIFRMIFEFAELNQDRFPKIVVCTFTRKATQEIKERLLKKAFQLKTEGDPRADIALKYFSQNQNLHVSTIHGVLSLFLKQQGYHLGLDSEFTIVEPYLCEFNRKKIFQDKLASNCPSYVEIYKLWKWSDISYFSEKYRLAKALNPNLKPMNLNNLILEINQFYNSLIQDFKKLLSFFQIHIDLKKDSAINKFCKELNDWLIMSEELHLKFPLNTECENTVSNWNNFINRYKQIPQRLGALKQVDDEAKELKKICHEKFQDFLSLDFIYSNQFEILQNQIELYENFLNDFSSTINNDKIKTGELTNLDLEIFSLLLANQNPLSTFEFSEEWHYWFVDEFQDTSPLQVNLLKKLIREKSYYLVGDPQQSIYFFRGARSEIFKNEWHHFLNHGFSTEHKVVNRRSKASLLSWINYFITELNSTQFTPMDHLEGLVEFDFGKNDKAQFQDIVSVDFYNSEGSEFELILNRIEELRLKNVKYSDIAILCRENADIEAIMTILKGYKIPVLNYSKGSFFENSLVQKYLSVYNFLLNPNDDLNFVAFVQFIFQHRSENSSLAYDEYFLSEKFLIPVIEWQRTQKKHSLWSSVCELYGVNTNLYHSQFLLFKHYLVKSTESPILSTWIEFVEKLGFLSQDNTIFWQLYYFLKNNKDHHQKIDMGELPMMKELEAVKIMTIHASKGLEFEHVFLPYLEKKVRKDGPDLFMYDEENQNYIMAFKNPRTKENIHIFKSYQIKNIEYEQLKLEQERLIYVAVTRAKSSLHFFLSEDSKSESSSWINFLKRT